MTIAEVKKYLKEVSAYGEQIRAAKDAEAVLRKMGLRKSDAITEEAIKEANERVRQAGLMMLRLPPEESRVLIARYVHGTPYVDLSEDELLAGMTQRTAERILARAVEHFGEVAEKWRKDAV